jgi:ethanolamine utilization microcompartment shell protein EutL
MTNASPLDLSRRFGPLALAFAAGLLAAGWAALTVWQRAYAAVDPQVTSFPSSPAVSAFYATLFLTGVAVAFLSAVATLAAVLEEVGTHDTETDVRAG